jgi:glycosyltransferase involved in cell wall biosynthesis
MISIIIPTKNEEEYLPKLLKSIHQQRFRDMEVIVADAGSKDGTVQIAKAHRCRVVPGGLPGKGRNEGAKVAKGDVLFFVDADALLPPHFVERFLREFDRRKLDVAGCSMKLPGKKKAYRIFEKLYTLYFKATERFYPHATNCIVIKRSLHEKIGGFDETMKLGEDFCYVRAAAKKGRFGFIPSLSFYASPRRAEEDMKKIIMQYFLAEMYMTFVGPIRTDLFKYRFDHAAKHKKKKQSS